MNTNTERNVHLVEAKLNDDYSSLSLVYKYEMKDGIHRREYPRIPIYIYKDKLPVISERNLDSYFDNYTYSYKYSYKINAGYGDEIQNSNGSCIFKDELIEPRVKELTVAEIEKLLGCKVKIKAEDE